MWRFLFAVTFLRVAIILGKPVDPLDDNFWTTLNSVKIPQNLFHLNAQIVQHRLPRLYKLYITGEGYS